MFKLFILLFLVLYFVYIVMIILQNFGVIKFTRNDITVGKALIPFYYWFKL